MINLSDLPAAPGSYVLQLHLERTRLIMIGRQGRQRFSSGDYYYVGSAHGAGGLRARVSRHLRGDGIPHWHIDYMRAIAEVQNVLYTVTDIPLECVWSQALAQLSPAIIPVPHFGSSDCRSGCAAHLVAFSRRVEIAAVLAPLTSTPIISLRLH